MRIVARLKRIHESEEALRKNPCWSTTKETGTQHCFPSLREAFSFALERTKGELWGQVEITDEAVRYVTASGLGKYTITQDRVEFEGRRRSFRDGCPVIRMWLRKIPEKIEENPLSGVRLDGLIYAAPPAEWLYLSPVARFSLDDVLVETLTPYRLHEIVTCCNCVKLEMFCPYPAFV